MTVKQPVDAQDAVIFNEPGRRARVARGDGGEPNAEGSRGAGYGIGAALKIMALVRLPGSHPSCQPSAEPKFSFRGRVRLASRASASAVCADSSASQRSVGRSAARETRGATQPGAQPDG